MIYTITVMVNIRSSTAFVVLFLAVFLASVVPAQEQAGARKIVSKVAAVYPELASKIQIKGIVKLEVLVAPNGKVKLAQVVGGSPILAQAAVDAVEKWRWAPAAQESKELIEINFHP
jgi:TonB family protein